MMSELIPPTPVKNTDSVVASSVNNPINHLFELIKQLGEGGGGIKELLVNTIEQYGTMPIGGIYVQYPGKKAPHELWPGTWTNVTSSYANCFFRAEGDLSNAFNAGYQGDAIREIWGSFGIIYGNSTSGAFYNIGGCRERTKHGNVSDAGVAFNASRVVPTANEVRPYNHAIRIWERTA